MSDILYFFTNPLVLLLLVIWSVIWKGLALWRAARLNKPIWFGIILVVNTLGILEIVYLVATRKHFEEFKNNKQANSN
ncbi:MAG: DUF5652 family protein [Patescibacteria group bacterium]